MVTKEDIENKLSCLIGQQPDVYKIANIIEDFFSTQPEFEIGRVYSWSHSRQTIWFKWRGKWVLEIKYSKRIQNKYSTRPCYVISSFTVNLFNSPHKNLEESIEYAEKEHKRYIDNKATLTEQSSDILKYARNKFKLEDAPLRALILYLGQHFYDILESIGDEDLTADEIAYKKYRHFEYSYQDYVDVCNQEEVEPKPRFY